MLNIDKNVNHFDISDENVSRDLTLNYLLFNPKYQILIKCLMNISFYKYI